MKTLPSSITTFITEFAKFYHATRSQAESLRSVKYRVITRFEEYKKTNKIELSLTDMPGNLLPPMTIHQIKQSQDIISGMHPIDVNSINDIYYIEREDEVEDLTIDAGKILLKNKSGILTFYDLDKTQIILNKFKSKRLAYLLGNKSAEDLIKTNLNSNNRKFKIVNDKITSLQSENLFTGEILEQSPLDILFSKQYLFYSKEEIAKIGYMCGQIANLPKIVS